MCVCLRACVCVFSPFQSAFSFFKLLIVQPRVKRKSFSTIKVLKLGVAVDFSGKGAI